MSLSRYHFGVVVWEGLVNSGSLLFIYIHALQIEIEQAGVGSLVGLGEGKETMLVVERQSIGVGIDGDKPATGLAVVAVGGDDSLNDHRTDALPTTGFTRGQAAYLQGGVALEHLALCEELLAETVVGGIAGEVGQGNAVVGKTEIAEHFTRDAVFPDITRGKAHAIIQRRICEDEVVQVFIAAVECCHLVILSKSAQL